MLRGPDYVRGVARLPREGQMSVDIAHVAGQGAVWIVEAKETWNWQALGQALGHASRGRGDGSRLARRRRNVPPLVRTGDGLAAGRASREREQKAGRMIEADTYVARPRCPPGRSASGGTETYIQEPSLPYFGTPKYRERHLPREGGYR